MSTFTILLGGDLTATGAVRELTRATRVIAADGGMRHAGPLGLVPELWVGDFDSADAALLARYKDVPREAHPAAKDQTDGELAIQRARGLGATSLVLAGAFGGHTDHALMHTQIAVKLALEGLGVVLTSGDETGYPLVPGTMPVPGAAGCTMSIIAFCTLAGLTLRGVQWPLDKATVLPGQSLTMSNTITKDARITLAGGSGLVMVRP